MLFRSVTVNGSDTLREKEVPKGDGSNKFESKEFIVPSVAVLDRRGQRSTFSYEFVKPAESNIPEIEGCNIAHVVLQLKTLGIDV